MINNCLFYPTGRINRKNQTVTLIGIDVVLRSLSMPDIIRTCEFHRDIRFSTGVHEQTNPLAGHQVWYGLLIVLFPAIKLHADFLDKSSAVVSNDHAHAVSLAHKYPKYLKEQNANENKHHASFECTWHGFTSRRNFTFLKLQLLKHFIINRSF